MIDKQNSKHSIRHVARTRHPVIRRSACRPLQTRKGGGAPKKTSVVIRSDPDPGRQAHAWARAIKARETLFLPEAFNEFRW